ncbi:hypothetical protein GCM10009647_066430 [Streptomyces sanglieri]|uniref:Transposase n=1 Tax=Streptomyces sanglieri TaxID=193460 RepID=A0ABW2XCL5_9ACTN
MTATTTPPDVPDLDDDAGVAEEAEELLELVAQYQRLNRAQRRRIAIAASPEMRTVLAGVERDMALKRSPRSMSAILTDGKEKHDALGREVGEPLWPIRYGKKALAKIRRAVGERVWWSLYMQKPRPLEGGVWKWAWIIDHRLTPMQFRGVDLTRIIVAVDTAGGSDDVNDETGLWAGGRDANGHAYVLADWSGRMGADTWGHAVCRLAIELSADAIVVESNCGGDMAKQIARRGSPGPP